jgi:hypothetical protein
MKEQATKSVVCSEPSIYSIIQTNPVFSGLIFLSLLLFIGYIFTKFRVTWKGHLPILTDKNDLRSQAIIDDLTAKLADMDDKMKAYRRFDFFEKTENGEHVGYSIAKRPYVEFWADGNWNSQEYHIQLDTFERLWDDEDEIIIYGNNPNLPSDLYAIIEKKAKELPKITILCSYAVSTFFKKYFSDFENIEIIVRGA